MGAGAEDLALGDGYRAATEPVRQGCRERVTTGLDAKHRAHRLAVADQHVGLPRQWLEYRPRVATAPQRFAVVEIEADRHVALVSGGEPVAQGRSRSVAQGRRDPGAVQPGRVCEYGGPVHVGGGDL